MHSLSLPRSFPNIKFNKRKDSSSSFQTTNSKIRKSYNPDEDSKFKTEFISKQEASYLKTEENDNYKTNRSPTKPYTITFNVENSAEKFTSDPETQRNEINFPNFDNQFTIDKDGSFIQKLEQEFPIMTQLMTRNSKVFEKSAKAENLQNYQSKKSLEIPMNTVQFISPQVQKIIDEFKTNSAIKEKKNEHNKIISSLELVNNVFINTKNQSKPDPDPLFEEIENVTNTIMNKIMTPSSSHQIKQSPEMNNIERHQLYQYMRDCHKIQKFRSDESVILSAKTFQKLEENQNKLRNQGQSNEISPLQYQQEVFVSPDQGIVEKGLFEISQQSRMNYQLQLKTVDIQQSKSRSNSNSQINRQAQNYVMKKATKAVWDEKNKENQQEIANRQRQQMQNYFESKEKNFFQRLEHDVNRRQHKIKNQELSSKNVSNKKQSTINKEKIFQMIDTLQNPKDKKKTQTLMKLKSSLEQLFDQLNKKEQNQKFRQVITKLQDNELQEQLMNLANLENLFD